MAADDAVNNIPNELTQIIDQPLVGNRSVSMASIIDVNEKARESVVKIFANHTEPNLLCPWTSWDPAPSYSSGFMIQGNRILCTAHGVEFVTSVKVRKHGSSQKFIAKILTVSHEANLAVLGVENPSFWKESRPLEFAIDKSDGLPNLQSEVVCLGYPIGGNQISITVGVVSRIGVTKYLHGGAKLPVVQTDAAINKGNNGGPAMQDGKVLGVNFSGRDDAQNIGYFIPIPIVMCFLNDVNYFGDFKGFGDLQFSWDVLENPSLRQYLQFDPKIGEKSESAVQERSGILIHDVPELSTAYGILKKDDIIMTMLGYEIGDDGTIQLRRSQRCSFKWPLTLTKPGDKIQIRLFRDGAEVEVEVEASMLDNSHMKCPIHECDIKPTYFVWAGLVLMNLTKPLLRHYYGAKNLGYYQLLMYETFYSKGNTADERVVVIPTILDHPINISYENTHKWTIVEKVNGEQIRNVKHIMELIEAAETEYIRIDCKHRGPIVMTRSLADKANKEIMRSHNVFSLKSEDLGGVMPGGVKEQDEEKYETSDYDKSMLINTLEENEFLKKQLEALRKECMTAEKELENLKAGKKGKVGANENVAPIMKFEGSAIV